MALSGICIFLCILVLVITKIGIVGTCVEMRANAVNGSGGKIVVRTQCALFGDEIKYYSFAFHS